MSKHDLLPDISKPGKIGCTLPESDVPPSELPPKDLLRKELGLPEVSESELVRYFTGLSKMNYGVDTGFYPLGSCTMKYNPKWHEDIPRLPGFASTHPLQPEETVQGALQLIFELQEYLAEITGMDAVSVLPMAGAHGELASQLMIKAYHYEQGDTDRKKILLTDSSHGTNPATSSMCGFEIGVVSTDKQGNVDMKSLNTLMNQEVAALTLTLPTTLGLFDPHIAEISELVHERGGLLWGDGANLNSLVGYVKFGDLGFDCMMVNLHKTFSTPHGGGGPGAGPVCARQKLTAFLPTPVVARERGRYRLVTPAKTIGKIGGFYGNFGVLTKAYAYIRSLGAEGLRQVAQDAVLNANYLREKLKAYYHLPYDRTCMHEVVFSHKRQAAKGVQTMDIAKRLLDYGLHPPTVYFPLIVDGALMTEPTETESKATLDEFIHAMIEIAKEAETNPDILHSAPHNTPVRRLDSARAARQPDLRWETSQTKTQK
jgi:glycine dehydrogenase subunit 2